MVKQIQAAVPRWQARLEIVGSEIFLRYRKRLMAPGIVAEIRRDYPSLSLVDVLVRVSAARRIIRDGDDFRVLAAIRGGAWRDRPETQERGVVVPTKKDDRTAHMLIALGRVLFAVFCAIALLAAVPQGAPVPIPLLVVLSLLALLLIATNGARPGSDR